MQLKTKIKPTWYQTTYKINYFIKQRIWSFRENDLFAGLV